MLLQGPNVMLGYLNRPEANAETLISDKDGVWLKTGDIAYVDPEGYYFVTDRLKELIKYKGFQVRSARAVRTRARADGFGGPRSRRRNWRRRSSNALSLPTQLSSGCTPRSKRLSFRERMVRRQLCSRDSELPLILRCSRSFCRGQEAERSFCGCAGVGRWTRCRSQEAARVRPSARPHEEAPLTLLLSGVKVVLTIPKSPSGKLLRRSACSSSLVVRSPRLTFAHFAVLREEAKAEMLANAPMPRAKL